MVAAALRKQRPLGPVRTSIFRPGNDNSTMYASIQAAWDGGYHCAVLSLREMAFAIPDKQLAVNARTLTGLLQFLRL